MSSLDSEDRWWIIHQHHYSDDTATDTASKMGLPLKIVESIIANGTEPEDCDHPHIMFEGDKYDEEGIRTCKHNWACPDCGYLQVG